MNTLENNKLIAEFMGADFGDCGDDIFIAFVNEDFAPTKSTAIDISDLKYHNSWDWLMPIVMQINIIDNYRFTVQIDSMDVTIHDHFKGGYVFKSDCDWSPDELIKSVYEAVTEFIKWYNNQNNQPQ